MTAQMSLYELLKSNVVFQNLDRYQFGILEQYLTFRGIETGEYLFFEGEVGDYVAFVVAGSIEILKQLPDKQMTLVTLKPGDSIGEMALIDDLSRSASAKATQRTGLIVLPKRDFERKSPLSDNICDAKQCLSKCGYRFWSMPARVAQTFKRCCTLRVLSRLPRCSLMNNAMSAFFAQRQRWGR